MNAVRSVHFKCRNGFYPRCSGVKRLEVPDDKVGWETDWPQYHPVDYTNPSILGQHWADSEISQTFQPLWNSLDGGVNRVSHEGNYNIVDSRPINPHGRTGLKGRGCLGRWGPNHAADPVVTRWKTGADSIVVKHLVSQRPILQFVAIMRQDCGEWAIPGGMVDSGEKVTQTLKREFMEEALNALQLNPGIDAQTMVDDIFSSGREVYSGYVDDPRNTDNAWMETVSVNYHDTDGTAAGRLQLQAGDDAAKVKWMDIDQTLELYASHRNFIQKVAAEHSAHW